MESQKSSELVEGVFNGVKQVGTNLCLSYVHNKKDCSLRCPDNFLQLSVKYKLSIDLMESQPINTLVYLYDSTSTVQQRLAFYWYQPLQTAPGCSYEQKCNAEEYL